MKSTILLIFLFVMNTRLQADTITDQDSSPAEAPAADNFDSMAMIGFVSQHCAGLSKSLIRIGGHPILLGEMVASSLSAGEQPLWTANFLEPAINNQLQNTVKDRMTKNSDCYFISGEYLRYENIASSTLKSIRANFGPYAKKFAPNGEYTPANEATQNLYKQCTPDAVTKSDYPTGNVQAINGKPTVLDSYVIQDIYTRVLNAMLIAKSPKSCADIDAINAEIVRNLARTDLVERAIIAKAGYSTK